MNSKPTINKINQGLLEIRSLKSCFKFDVWAFGGCTLSFVVRKVINNKIAKKTDIKYIALLYPLSWLIIEISDSFKSFSPETKKVYFAFAFIEKLFPIEGSSFLFSKENFAILFSVLMFTFW